MWRELPPQNFVSDSLFIIRANEIVIENSKKGKMNTVLAIFKVIGDKFTDSRNTGLSFGSSRKCYHSLQFFHTFGVRVGGGGGG